MNILKVMVRNEDLIKTSNRSDVPGLTRSYLSIISEEVGVVPTTTFESSVTEKSSSNPSSVKAQKPNTLEE